MNAHRRLIITAAGALSATALAAAPATAAPVAYEGSTSAGQVAFDRDGDTVTGLAGWVATACASTRTADTKAGADSFFFEQPVAIGGEVEQTAKHETMLSWGTADKTYRVTLTPKADGTIDGHVVATFMIFEPYYNAWGYLDANTFACQGEGDFTAAPVAAPEPAKAADQPKKGKKKKRKKGKRARG